MAAQPTPRRVDLKPLSYTEMRNVLMGKCVHFFSIPWNKSYKDKYFLSV